MYRYKAMFGDRLSSRGFASQRCEAFIKCGIMNRVLDLGMPQSIAVTYAQGPTSSHRCALPQLYATTPLQTSSKKYLFPPLFFLR